MKNLVAGVKGKLLVGALAIGVVGAGASAAGASNFSFIEQLGNYLGVITNDAAEQASNSVVTKKPGTSETYEKRIIFQLEDATNNVTNTLTNEFTESVASGNAKVEEHFNTLKKDISDLESETLEEGTSKINAAVDNKVEDIIGDIEQSAVNKINHELDSIGYKDFNVSRESTVE